MTPQLIKRATHRNRLAALTGRAAGFTKAAWFRNLRTWLSAAASPARGRLPMAPRPWASLAAGPRPESGLTFQDSSAALSKPFGRAFSYRTRKMLLTLTTTHRPATDLGYLLMKNPANVHETELPFGRATIFYPEADEARCTAALTVEVDPV